jgi:hypothetical protein
MKHEFIALEVNLLLSSNQFLLLRKFKYQEKNNFIGTSKNLDFPGSSNVISRVLDTAFCGSGNFLRCLRNFSITAGWLWVRLSVTDILQSKRRSFWGVLPESLSPKDFQTFLSHLVHKDFSRLQESA